MSIFVFLLMFSFGVQQTDWETWQKGRLEGSWVPWHRQQSPSWFHSCAAGCGSPSGCYLQHHKAWAPILGDWNYFEMEFDCPYQRYSLGFLVLVAFVYRAMENERLRMFPWKYLSIYNILLLGVFLGSSYSYKMRSCRLPVVTSGSLWPRNQS